MRRVVLGGWLWLAIPALVPGWATAQIVPNPCCDVCHLPPAQCHCTVSRPVVKTQYRQEQVTTYRDVTETHLRPETCIQQVPVTTVENVTVDEGGYQMVWVPKPVTKQVAKTVMQQQVTQRMVPYQVTRKVPQTATRLVPYQTVEHVTQTLPVVTQAPCNTCDPLTFGAVAPLAVIPQTTAIAVPSIATPLPQTAAAPVELQTPIATKPSYDEDWTPIPPRSAHSQHHDRYGDYEPVPPRRTSNAGEKKFVPAPSAAAVWNSRFGGTSMR